MITNSPRRALMIAAPLAIALLLALLGQRATATGTTAQSPTVITVWLGNYPIPGYLDQRIALAKEFNQRHPQYEVHVEAHPYDSVPADVAKAVAQGQGPTVANYYFNATQQAIDLRTPDGRPVFTSIQSAIRGRKQILGVPVVTGDLLPNARATYSQHGELLAQPVTSQTSVLFANQSILQRAGIRSMPRTWQELSDDCRRLAAMPGGPKHCVGWPNHNWYFQQALAQQGGVLVNNANGRMARATATELASPQMLRYAQWWKSMHTAGYYYYSGKPEDWLSTSQAFQQGDLAFMMDSTNHDIFMPTPFTKIASGLPVPFATRPGQGVPNIASGDALWLRSGLSQREQDGALAFIQFLSSPEALAAFAEKTGYLPVTRSGIRRLADSGWLAAHPGAQAGIQRMESAPVQPQYLNALTGNFDPIQQQLLSAMDDVLNHNVPLVSRFREAQRTADQNLAAYNALCPGPGAHPDWCYRIGAGG
jgi:sn-glycerol 3-phosphate transport system substrate-binding protein